MKIEQYGVIIQGVTNKVFVSVLNIEAYRKENPEMRIQQAADATVPGSTRKKRGAAAAGPQAPASIPQHTPPAATAPAKLGPPNHFLPPGSNGPPTHTAPEDNSTMANAASAEEGGDEIEVSWAMEPLDAAFGELREVFVTLLKAAAASAEPAEPAEPAAQPGKVALTCVSCKNVSADKTHCTIFAAQPPFWVVVDARNQCQSFAVDVPQTGGWRTGPALDNEIPF